MFEGKIWDLSSKKFLFWTGWIGFVLSMQFYLWLIAVILYLFFDREKTNIDKYQIDKSYLKFVIVVGNIMLPITLILLMVIF